MQRCVLNQIGALQPNARFARIYRCALARRIRDRRNSRHTEPFLDPLGRSAVAQTRISGREFHLLLLDNADDTETSVSIYHEILEAMTVASANPPDTVLDFNEGDFERAGYQAHVKFGFATPEKLSRMLQNYGFQGE